MSETTTIERKYALTRIVAGDYLLPSNDDKTMWRIARYTDGPTNGLNLPTDRQFWGIWRWHEPLRLGGGVDVDDWDRWEFCEGLCDTRDIAIKRALRFA